MLSRANFEERSMKLPAALAAAALLALAVVFGSTSQQPAAVEIALLNEETWEAYAPQGKEVDAIYGDYVLRNEHLTAVVAQPLESRDANMTVRQVAGALIDLTVRDPQSDQLSAFYPGRRNYPFRSVQAAGGDAGTTELDLAQSPVHQGKAGAITVRAEAAENRPAVEVTYRLEAGAPYLTVTTRYTNAGDNPLTVPLEDDLRADGGKEDMVKSPNGVADLFWIHDRYWGQAYGLTAEGRPIQSQSNSRTTVLKYRRPNGEDEITLEPGQSFELVRRIFPGTNLLDVRAVAREFQGTTSRPVEFVVRGADDRVIDGARLEFVRAGDVLGSGRTDSQGRMTTSLPPGDYRVRIIDLGVKLLGGQGLGVRILDTAETQRFSLQTANYRPGRVTARITDEAGNPLPCKVEFIAQAGTPQPDFGPETAAFAVRNLRYAPLGQFVQKLPSGRYEVVISHGPEFDAIFTEITVNPGEDVPLIGKLVRSVETPGWISSDFHSHSSPSGDNSGSQLGRVLNLVCEHIEFAPCTEHNRISTYKPHIERLQIGQFLSTVSGMELTNRPLPLNHQNAFPLKRKPHTQDGGGPQTDSDPAVQIERLALWDNRSEKLVQVNHPDIGWMFYDRDGDGERDAGYERMVAQMDVMEIHPVSNALRLEPFEYLSGRKGNNRVFNWLQLLNQGFRIPGVVNTDAHYNYHGSGGLRNWIQSSTDEPAEIKPLDVVHAAEQGRLIMSNGPFLEVSLTETGRNDAAATAGQDLEARSGKLTVHARVQCPNWFDVDRLFVLVNGRMHATHNYNRQDHPDRFRNGVVKFDERMELELDGDAHVIVVTGGENTKLGRVLGPFWGEFQPAALSNPVFVDVDGGGFRANGDTLGHPLPVRYDPDRSR